MALTTLKALPPQTYKEVLTMIQTSTALYKGWLPVKQGSLPFLNPDDLRTICALLVGNATGRTPTSNDKSFHESAVTILLLLDSDKLAQFENNPNSLTPWLETLSQNDECYVAYIQFLVKLIKSKVFSGQFNELNPIFKESLQCQDWQQTYLGN